MILTPDQIRQLAEALKQVQASGHGAVKIQVQAGHPRFIVVSMSYEYRQEV